MIQYEDLTRNVYTDEILSLLAELDAEYCMDATSTFHMISLYVLKYRIHSPYTPKYMEYLLDEHAY